MRFRSCTATIVILLAVIASAQNPASGKRSITEKDLFDFVWITDPQVSPDGSRVAFTRVVVDEKRSGYETSIWMTATGGAESPIRLTNGKHDSSPRWSDDGRAIAFVRAGEKDDEGKPRPAQIALLSLNGGKRARSPIFQREPAIRYGRPTASALSSSAQPHLRTLKSRSARAALRSQNLIKTN